MLIYNITLKIEWTIQPRWLAWTKEFYIKKIMESGCFSKYQFVRLIEIEEDDGPTYALQLYAAGKEKYEYYIANSMAENEALSYEKWQNSVLSFSTLMEIVN